MLNYFKDIQGNCAGLSVLWVYGKRIEDELVIDPQKQKDDKNSFNAVYKSLQKNSGSGYSW